jgi:O-antigen ligase
MAAQPAVPAPGKAGQRLHMALWLLLCLFVFSLPVMEATKNLAAAGFLLLWTLRAAITRDLGGRWDHFDTALALMLVSAVLSASFGGHADALSGTVRVLALGWLVKRTAWRRREQATVLAAACLGLFGGVVAGAIPFLQGAKPFFELASVGHVNQSGLYIAILACAALGWALQPVRWGLAMRLATVGAALLFAATLVVTASRAALLAYAVFVLALLVRLAWHRGKGLRLGRLLGGAVLVLGLLAASLVLLGRAFPEMAGHKLQASELTSVANVEHRVRHWNIAVEAWRQKPWLGFGPESFGRLTERQACDWKQQRGGVCRIEDYAAASHAHSLYVSTLVERGLLGVAALGLLLVLWAGTLLRSWRRRGDATRWSASAAGLAVVAVGGLFNTTLRVEHGSLALLFLAFWLSPRLAGRVHH